jgi:hypothetical protein
MKNHSGFFAALPMILAAALAVADDFHVAPDGNDANPGTQDKPFASIARARDAVRQAKSTSEGPRTIWVHGGTYYLEKTLAFGPDDSGTEKAPVVYSAFGGEQVVLSGGREVTGRKPFREKIWQCDLKAIGLKEPRFKELYYNGRWQPSARVPNFDPKHPRTGGFLYVHEGGAGAKRGARKRG